MIVHSILYVAKQDKSTELYSQLLAIKPKLNVPGMTEFELSKNHILGLMPESGILKILDKSKIGSTAFPKGLRTELYFRVEMPEQYLERAKDLGLIELSPLEKRNWGDQVGYVMDQDGNVLAFARTLS